MITVAIPVYNGEKFIEEAIKSVSDQTYPVREVIISDDCSMDASFYIIKSSQYKFSNLNLTYFKNSNNIGYAENWNRCFKYCKSKYLMILHQDDILKKHTVEILYNFLNANPDIALAGGYEDFINERGNIIKFKEKPDVTKIYTKGQIFEFVKNHNSYIACSSVMFDMEKINRVGYFDTDVIATDELYWPKVLSKYSIAILGESLIYRRSHPNQTEYNHFIKYEKEALKIYEKFKRVANYEERLFYKKKILNLLKWKFSKAWIGIAANVAKQGYKTIPFKYVRRAILINPLIIFYFPKMWKSFVKIIVFIFTK